MPVAEYVFSRVADLKPATFHRDFFRILSTLKHAYLQEHSSGCFRHKFVYYFVEEIKRNKKQIFSLAVAKK